MSVSRRLVYWRLVAMLVVVSALAAGTAIAQTEQVRVKVGPANVYDKPRTSSDVVLVAQEGMRLDVLKREDTWYWVVLPPDANGTRRGGYIPAYLVERIAPKSIVEAGGGGAQPAPRSAPPPPEAAQPVSASPAPSNRYFFGIGGGGQSSSRAFADNVVFPLYDENGQYHARYSTPTASALDAMVGVRLTPRLVLAVAFWRSTGLPDAAISASVPHPFSYNTARSTTADLVVSRMENDGHLQLTWLMPVTRRIDVSIFGGPSLFHLRQDMVSGLSFRETYPYDTVAIAGFESARRSKTGIGANAGVDVTVMAWRNIGVGASARYARGSLTLSAVNEGSVTVQVGGAQVSGGLRLRF
jgi:hypothetical protein